MTMSRNSQPNKQLKNEIETLIIKKIEHGSESATSVKKALV